MSPLHNDQVHDCRSMAHRGSPAGIFPRQSSMIGGSEGPCLLPLMTRYKYSSYSGAVQAAEGYRIPRESY